MKRIIALLLVALMCFSTLAGCGCQRQEVIEPAPTEPAVEVVEPAVDENLDKALEYLRVFYLNVPEKTPMDYTRLGTVRVADSVYEVVWTVTIEDETVDPSLIKVVVNEDGTVTIDVDDAFIYDSTQSIPYVLTATITGTDGRVVSLSWNHIIPPGIDEEACAIVDAAYALKEGAALEGTYTLTGVITTIDEMYSEKYGNITVTMAVRGREDFPIKCYRLKGQGADMLAIGDTITVTGTLKNYYGTIEFDAGCILENVVSGGGTPPTAPEDPLEILAEAYKLKKGQSLPYEVTLTGKISKIAYTWNEEYPNPTFEIVVQGQTSKPIYCYMVEGRTDWLKKIEITDTVTLTGIITNYQGTVEFNRPTMTYWKRGPGLTQAVNYGSLEEGVAYKMYMDQKTLGKTYYFNGSFSSYLGTTTNAAKAVDVFMEKVEGKGVRFYYMDGEAKTYIEIYLNNEGKPRPKVTTNPSVVFNYSKSAKTYCVMLDSQEYYLGTYSTYSTIAASSTFYITGDNAGNRNKTQFLAKFIKSDEVDTGAGGEEVEPDILTATAMTTAPVAGDVVVMANGTNGMTSMMLAEAVTVTEGALTGTTNLAQFTVGIDENGRYTFQTADGKYLTSGKTGSSLTLESSATNYSKWILEETGDGTYYLKNYKAVYNAGGTEKPQFVEYYGGAFTTYSFQSSKSDIYEITFYNNLVITGTGNEVVEAPTAGTAYYMMIDQKNLDKTLFFNGQTEAGVSYRLATTENGAEAVPVYLEETTGGYHLYFMNGDVKTYIRVFHRTDGDPGYGKGSLEYVTTAPAEVFTFDKTYDTLVYDYDGNNAYYMGTYSTYNTISVSNTSYLTTATVDDSQFPIRFSLTANSGVPGGDEEKPGTGDEPIIGGESIGTVLTAAPVDGDVIVIGNGSNIMTAIASGSKLAAETATITDGTVAVTDTMAQLTVSIDGNGYYTFTTADGKYLTSGATGNSLSLADAASDYSLWTVEAATADTFYIKNVNANYNGKIQSLEYYSGFTTYGHNTTAIYQMGMYKVTAAEEEISGGVLMTTAPVAGDVIVVGNGSNVMTATASGSKLAAETATVAEGVLALTDTMAQLTVSIDSNGYYTFTTADGKYLTSGATGNSLSLADAASDYSLWTVEAATADTFYIKNVNANYNGKVQSLEYYSGFTTYGHNTTAIYQMSLYKVTAGAGDQPGGGSGEEPGGETTVNYGPLAENTAYKFYLEQASLGKTLYFNGSMSGEYLAASEAEAEGVDVYMEKVEGEGVRFYFKNGETKTYIEVYKNANSKIRPQLVTEPTTVFTYDADAKVYVVAIDETNYYLGTYSTFTTFSASGTHYITGSNAANVGVSQFVGQFKKSDGTQTPDEPEKPEVTINYGPLDENTAYKFYLEQVSLGKTLYFNGSMSGEYLAASEAEAEGVEVYMEKVEDKGVRFYFKDGETKTYIEVYKNANSKIRPQLVTEPTTVFTYDADAKVYVVTIDGTNYYLGTYSTYNTFSASGTHYITGSNAANVGVSQFVGQFKKCDAAEEEGGSGNVSGAANISFADEANRESVAYDKQVWKMNGITFINEKAESSSDVADYANPVRCYKGSSVTIEYPGITKLVFHCDDYKDYATPLVESITTGTVTVDGDVVTVVLDTAVDSYKIDTMSAQVRIDSIDVNPTDSDKEEEETPTVPATLAEQIAEANKLANGAYLTYESTITGTITSEVEISTKVEGTYKFTVTDANGNEILCYWVPVASAPAKGDTITVTGKLSAFNGAAQFTSTASTSLAAAAQAVAEEAPAETAVEAPTAETPVEEAPVVEAPVVEAPVEEVPVEEPAAEVPAE